MPANPEYGSQEHNKPKPNEAEGKNVVFSLAEQQAAERLGKPPPLATPANPDNPDVLKPPKHEQFGEQASGGRSERSQSRSSRTIWEKVCDVSEILASGGFSLLQKPKRK